MDRGVLLALVLVAAAVAFGLMSFEQWVRSPDTVWHRIWQTYKRWYDEQASYIFERRPAAEQAKQHMIIAIGALLVGVAVSSQPLVIAGIFAFGVFVPFMSIRDRVQKRRHDLLMQIDPALQFMANALQVTPNLEEALLLVAQHMKPPISEEMRRVVTSYRMGQNLDAALQGMADRCNDPFVTSMVMALIVGRRTGGNISQTLREIAVSTREVTRIELELASKTKGQRNQFYLVIMLYPITLFGLKQSLPQAWDTLTDTLSGRMALLGSMGIMAVATMWALSILSPKNL